MWTSASITSYADDTTMSLHGNDMDSLRTRLEEEASGGFSYMDSNGLVANESKTEYMIISKPCDKVTGETLRVGNAKISSKDSVSLLGTEVTSDLSWKKHMEKLRSEMSKRLGVLRQLKCHLPRQSLLPVCAWIIHIQN